MPNELSQVSCHIQDIPENGADVAHLSAIHRTSIAGGGEPSSALSALLDAITWHDWNVTWTPDTAPGRKHAAVVQLTHSMKVAGRLQLFSLKVTIVIDCPSI
jgi:cholesterol 7-dehydrogenase